MDGIVAGLVAAPERYAAQVLAAQAVLARFSAHAFRSRFAAAIGSGRGVAA
ncbi:MAG: hypothetical protein V9G18_20525 [Albidovulum sp.]